MPPALTPLALAVGDRWLIAFSLATAAVLVAGVAVRHVARDARARARARGEETRGLRRNAGVLLALGPLVGFVVAPTLDEGALVVVVGRGRHLP